MRQTLTPLPPAVDEVRVERLTVPGVSVASHVVTSMHVLGVTTSNGGLLAQSDSAVILLPDLVPVRYVKYRKAV